MFVPDNSPIEYLTVHAIVMIIAAPKMPYSNKVRRRAIFGGPRLNLYVHKKDISRAEGPARPPDRRWDVVSGFALAIQFP